MFLGLAWRQAAVPKSEFITYEYRSVTCFDDFPQFDMKILGLDLKRGHYRFLPDYSHITLFHSSAHEAELDDC
jgi:hypothetical protein